MTWDPRCGSEAGEKAHRYRKEPVCNECRRAAAHARKARKLRTQGPPRPHHNEHCPGCGWYMKVEWNGLRCVNDACATVGVCI